MGNKRKPTNGQLQRRIDNALLHIDKTKDTENIFFSDKGLRVTVNEEYAIIETNYHRHVFSNITSGGISRPWLYAKKFVDIANDNDCKNNDGYSFRMLWENLKKKEDKTEYNLCVYFEWWLYNIFSPLYSIGESDAESFMVYEDYLHNIARQSILLSEKTEDITNKRFIEMVIDKIKEYSGNIEENVILKKKTDEEIINENIEAIQEQEISEEMTNESEN